MRTAIRKHMRDFIAIVLLVLVAGFTAFYVLANQRTKLPEWVPYAGKDVFTLKGEFSTAQAITPGQGQTVNIAGVQVGEISNVELVDGRAIVTMELEREYEDRVHPDATMLLRPKTGLKDMIVELDPGTRAAGPPVRDGYTVPISRTLPDVNLDEFLSVLDRDTRTYLQLLLNGAATGLEGQGGTLAQVWRRFAPTARDAARFTELLRERRRNIKRAVHNFGVFTQALAARDDDLARFVDSSNDVFARFAAQDDNLQRTIAALPAALRDTEAALRQVRAFADESGPALQALLPGARALGPSLVATRPFLRETTPIIRDQLRPFTEIATPVLRTLRPAAAEFADATPNLQASFEVLNAFLNGLAYNPPGREEGYLFYLAWLNHVTNSMFSSQDALGAIRRGMLVIDCEALAGLNGQKQPRVPNPSVDAVRLLAQLVNLPNYTLQDRDTSNDGYCAGQLIG